MTDGNGRVTTYEYDNLDRMTAEKWYTNQTHLNTTPNSPLHTISYVYDAASQLELVSDAFAAYDFGYDRLGRATSITADLTGLTDNVVFTQAFDAAGNRTQLAAEIGGVDDFVNDYLYDALHRMTRVTQDGVGGGSSVADNRVDFGYLRDGRFSTIQRYANTAGTQLVAQSDFAYDSTGRLSGLAHKKGGTTFANYGWTYDVANRITAFTNSQHTDENATYSYDNRGQLTGADRSGTTSDETYVYDDNGNRISGGFGVGVNNQLTTDGTYNYTYDVEGNITQRTAGDGSYTDYGWDHRNRLAKVTNFNSSQAQTSRVEYRYDANNHMVGRQVFLNGSSTPSEQQAFIYEDGQIVLAFDKAGSGNLATADLAHRYLWGPAVDQLLADEAIESLTNAALNEVLWPLTDHLGTVRDWINSSATVLDHAQYDAFGRRLGAATVDAAFGWTGRYRDPLTGLEYHDARWYNPDIQRWMSEDPIGFAGGDANLNRYVGNMPTLYVDPDGLEAQDPWWDDSWRDYLYPWSWGYWAGNGIGDFASSVYYIDSDFAGNRTAGQAAVRRQTQDINCVEDHRTHQMLGNFSETVISDSAEATIQFTGAGLGGAFLRPGAGSTIRNSRLAGRPHPVTKIPFDKHGFPDFSSVATHTVKINQTGNRAADAIAANKAAGLDCTPKGYTWHHHQDGTTMQLVPRKIHQKTGHTGGVALGDE